MTVAFNRNAVAAAFRIILMECHNRLAVQNSDLAIPNVAEAATLGWRP
jgi:hypothetical protein